MARSCGEAVMTNRLILIYQLRIAAIRADASHDFKLAKLLTKTINELEKQDEPQKRSA